MTQRLASSGKGLWAAGGSVIAAAVASACCWLPLLLVAFGASAAGVSASFERFRPLMLGVTGILLAGGFYFTYFHKTACAPGEACATPSRRLHRFNRVLLWLATVAVAAFAAFPNYAGLLSPSGDAVSEDTAHLPRVALVVEGMTCEACAVHVERELRNVLGVREASVDYRAGRATVAVDPVGRPGMEALIQAVERAGYQSRPVDAP